MQSNEATAPAAKTKNMAKLSAHSNAITWFEIPAMDIDRAASFYETVLDIKLTPVKTGVEGEMRLFPRLENVTMGKTDMVSGALLKNKTVRPSQEGVVVYLNANPSVQTVIDRVEQAGGKVVVPRTKNLAGYFAMIVDTEGNKIGLFAGE